MRLGYSKKNMPWADKYVEPLLVLAFVDFCRSEYWRY